MTNEYKCDRPANMSSHASLSDLLYLAPLMSMYHVPRAASMHVIEQQGPEKRATLTLMRWHQGSFLLCLALALALAFAFALGSAIALSGLLGDLGIDTNLERLRTMAALVVLPRERRLGLRFDTVEQLLYLSPEAEFRNGLPHVFTAQPVRVNEFHHAGHVCAAAWALEWRVERGLQHGQIVQAQSGAAATYTRVRVQRKLTQQPLALVLP